MRVAFTGSRDGMTEQHKQTPIGCPGECEATKHDLGWLRRQLGRVVQSAR